MLKRVFFINHAPKEFHNLLVVLVIIGMLFLTFFLLFETHTIEKIKTATVEKREKAFKAAYDLVINDGYTDSEADFDSLLKVNSEAVDHVYELFYKNYDIKKWGNLITGEYNVVKWKDRFLYVMGLPFKYKVTEPYWKKEFIDFGVCCGGIFLSLILMNFTFKPIANKYKHFWILPYLISVIIPFLMVFVVLKQDVY